MPRMRHLLAGLGILWTVVFFLPGVSTADELGLSAKEAYDLATRNNEPVLFVDVRDPVEIMFVGFTDTVDINIPYLLVDRTKWEEDKQRFRLYRNPDFIADISKALEERGLDKTATIITMCRSGSERGKPSAQALVDNGFPNARYVLHGFQGSALKEGPHKGFRLKNGWQNSGLPWQSKMNPDKIYRVDRK